MSFIPRINMLMLGASLVYVFVTNVVQYDGLIILLDSASGHYLVFQGGVVVYSIVLSLASGQPVGSLSLFQVMSQL